MQVGVFFRRKKSSCPVYSPFLLLRSLFICALN